MVPELNSRQKWHLLPMGSCITHTHTLVLVFTTATHTHTHTHACWKCKTCICINWYVCMVSVVCFDCSFLQYGQNLLHAAVTGGNIELVQSLITEHKLVPADTKVNIIQDLLNLCQMLYVSFWIQVA